MYDRLAHLYDNAARDIFSAQAAQVTQEELDRLLLLKSNAPANAPPTFTAKDRLTLIATDLACGTGLLSWMVAGLGPRVIGVDVAEAMLEVAKDRAAPLSVPALTTPPEFVLGDILSYQPSSPVDIALCFGDVVNHLLEKEQVETLFETTAKSLKDGGVFVLDATELSTFKSILWNSEVDENYDDGTRLNTSVSFDEADELAVMRFTSWAKGEDAAGPPSHVEEVRERHYPAPFLIEALNAAGFSNVRTRRWKPFDVVDTSVPVAKTIFVAQK